MLNILNFSFLPVQLVEQVSTANIYLPLIRSILFEQLYACLDWVDLNDRLRSFGFQPFLTLFDHSFMKTILSFEKLCAVYAAIDDPHLFEVVVILGFPKITGAEKAGHKQFEAKLATRMQIKKDAKKIRFKHVKGVVPFESVCSSFQTNDCLSLPKKPYLDPNKHFIPEH